MANFRKNTRYTNGNTTVDREGNKFLVLRKQLNLEPGSDDIFVKITSKYVNRPDLVAHTAYKDTSLWWVIFEFNSIVDPFFDLKLERILRLPSKERVLKAINSLNKA